MELLNRCVRGALLVAGIALGLTFPLAGQAGDDESHGKEVLSSMPEEYADFDASDCMECHDENSEYPVISILATPHAVKADERTPLAQQHACQTCHGSAAAHLQDSTTPPPVAFGPEHPSGPQNESCLGCHQGGSRINWPGSVHASSDVACSSCHTIHALEDPVTVKNRRPDTPVMRTGQTAVCLQCHTEKRAELHKTSSHPIRDGLMDCSDCHSPHGSVGPTGLVKPTLSRTRSAVCNRALVCFTIAGSGVTWSGPNRRMSVTASSNSYWPLVNSMRIRPRLSSSRRWMKRCGWLGAI